LEEKGYDCEIGYVIFDWKNLLKGLLNSGYIQAKFELTGEGKNYLEELREDY